VLLAQTSRGIARVADGGLELLAVGGRSLDDYIVTGRLAELARQAASGAATWDQVTIAAPVRHPGKIIIVGLNYRDHAAETGSPLPSFPRFHLVPGSAVTGSGATVTMPGFAAGQVDYEGELAVVIGRTGRDIRQDSAWDGDVMLTGTPGGVGLTDGRFLAGGDVVTVTIEHIGTLTSTLADAKPLISTRDQGAVVRS
jgi:2-keto-4-pentenoate hydratase/2-oxohepta-3-ene-1,7-dioic acid hydratase in catechol pathway